MTLLLSLALGALIGLSLGALGGGGSILTVPALVYLLGQPAQAATTASLVIVGITALVGASGHARSGHVRWAAGSVFGLIGVAASYAGTALNRAVNPNLLLLAFAALMLVAAAGMLTRTRPRPAPLTERHPAMAVTGTVDAHPITGSTAPTPAAPAPAHTHPVAAAHPGPSTIAKLLVAGLLVGFLTGFLGVGGGFVIVPALVMVLGYGMPTAVGTSLLVIAINSAAALCARAGAETFHWAVIIPFTLAAVAGSVAGKHAADRVRAATLIRSFAGLLIAVAIYVTTRSLLALA